MKKCCKCKIEKNYSEFYRDRTKKDGYNYRCKSCSLDKSLGRKKNLRFKVRYMYHDMISHSKYRSEKEGVSYTVDFSKEEFFEWCFSQKKLHSLWEIYKNSNFNKEYSPSINRINDYKGYSFDNIELTYWGDNRRKGDRARREGFNTKQSKPVVQSDSNGNVIEIHKSLSIASRKTGACISSIIGCCKGRQKTAKGYKWKYYE